MQNKLTKNPSKLVINVALRLGTWPWTYYCMEHVDNQGVPCHNYQATMFKGMHLEYVPRLGQAMKDWIMDNVRLGLPIAQIMVKHAQHYFDEDPTK